MTQFNFTTNIEKRMSMTGKVFCIDRMTSDYAEQHPLDVDAFIESVFQEFAGTEYEESRESLRSIWTAALSVSNPRGDASLYPNKNGARRAAAMKVWAKADDYWRMGLHQGDTLPDMPPMCKVTRMEDKWIALFPHDKHLLLSTDTTGHEHEPVETPSVETTRNQSNPIQLDLFAQLQQENATLQARIAELERQLQQRTGNRLAGPSNNGNRLSPMLRRCRSHMQPATHDSQMAGVTATGNHHAWLKTAGYLAAASVALLVIWQTGLLIPIGLIGLATSGLLK